MHLYVCICIYLHVLPPSNTNGFCPRQYLVLVRIFMYVHVFRMYLYVLSVIVLEIKTGILVGSFLPSDRLEMSEVSEVSEELRVYAVGERKCWTETKILDVLKEVEDYALDSHCPLPSICAYDKLAEKSRTALEARIS